MSILMGLMSTLDENESPFKIVICNLMVLKSRNNKDSY